MTCAIAGCAKSVHCRGWCQAHYHRWRRYGDATSPVRGEDRDALERECRKCKRTLPIEEFYLRSPTLRRRECKACCISAASKLAKAVEPGDEKWMRRREGSLRRKYGIGHAEFDAMLAAQNGRCALCGLVPKIPKRQKYEQWTAFHIDHCHETGRVRGLLCARCNVTLGWIEARPDYLSRVESYLAAPLQ